MSVNKLSPETMRSINFTLRLQVRYYMKSYSDSLNNAYKLSDLVDDIHFYWFRNSLVREYKWTKDFDTIVYIEKNSDEMKFKIKELAIIELNKVNSKKRKVNNLKRRKRKPVSNRLGNIKIREEFNRKLNEKKQTREVVSSSS